MLPLRLDSAMHDATPAYLRNLIANAGLDQVGAAKLLGISERALRYYLTDEDKPKYRPAPYLVQFGLEFLAEQRMSQQIVQRMIAAKSKKKG
jgi:predicted transcriptional regulator